MQDHHKKKLTTQAEAKASYNIWSPVLNILLDAPLRFENG
jgi:hypothetical protein